ncbi:MAG TPA: polysaccharide deacetylase family protein [Caulobacteraceae bacterium]|jgi:peptidoglycan/xylan/chitin deacetylase (PgdA/CDA1 family)|nr:polysaccharide deacetylase family protein [Caulobacteraceae bacterium]
MHTTVTVEAHVERVMSFAYRLSAFAARRVTVKPVRLTLVRPVASFSFDDFPISAWTVGGPILDRFGAKATYYAAGDFCGRQVDGLDYFDEQTLREIAAAGHEIGCHSFSHEPSPFIRSELLTDDLDRNSIFLREALGPDAGTFSFAYPYGQLCARTKRLMAGRYPSSRGIHPGVNGAVTDLAQLKAIPLERRSWRAATVQRWIEAAKVQKGWLVFFSHDVSDDPSPYGCTPAMLEHALASARAAGFDVLPVKEALAAAGA